MSPERMQTLARMLISLRDEAAAQAAASQAIVAQANAILAQLAAETSVPSGPQPVADAKPEKKKKKGTAFFGDTDKEESHAA